jgi:hypothetical protein
MAKLSYERFGGIREDLSFMEGVTAAPDCLAILGPGYWKKPLKIKRRLKFIPVDINKTLSFAISKLDPLEP